MAGILKGIRAAFGDVEMAPYTVLVEREGYEERLYPAKKWACTRMQGCSQKEMMGPMFRILFNYISGKNAPNLRIDMTSPVTTHIASPTDTESDPVMTMAFLVPGDHQDQPPDPGKGTVFLEDRPEMVVLVRQFGGFVNDEVIVREKAALEASVKKCGEEGVNFDQFFIVGYDPPFKLINRRNEIWFIKNRKTTEDQENGNVVGEGALIEENGMIE